MVQHLTMIEEKGQYLSCSWDKSIRVWFAPKGKGKEARDQDASVFSETQLEEDEVRYNPLFQLIFLSYCLFYFLVRFHIRYGECDHSLILFDIPALSNDIFADCWG